MYRKFIPENYNSICEKGFVLLFISKKVIYFKTMLSETSVLDEKVKRLLVVFGSYILGVIFNILIRSPLRRLNSILGRLRKCRRSSYSMFLTLVINLVNERCTFFMSSTYFLWLLFHTTLAYPIIGLTRALKMGP